MGSIRDMSIRSKLLLITMLTTVLGLVIAAIALYTYELQTYRERLAQNYVGLTHAIEAGSATALTFDDPDYAAEIIGQVVRSVADVTAGAIYDEDGGIFVALRMADGQIAAYTPPPAESDTHRVTAGEVLHVYHDVRSDEQFVGTVYLEVQLPGARERARNYAKLIGVVLLVSVTIAFLLGSALIRVISRPILELVETTRQVREENNYSLRAEKDSQDELGDLIDSFNAMLEQIQLRDQELAGHRDQLEAEVLLRTEEIRKLSLAVEQSPSTMVITDAKGTPEYVNPRFTEVTGYTSKEAEEVDPRIITSGDLAGESLDEMNAALEEGREWSGEFQNQRKGGGKFWESARVAPVRSADGDVTHYVWIKEDITAQKNAEAALRKSEERYALAAQGSNDGLWDWDLQNHSVYYSSRWKEMLGYDEHQIDDRPGEWFSRVHEDDIDSLRMALHNHLDGKTPLFMKEFRIRHRDGHYLWVLSRGVSVLDESGKPNRLAGSQTDITARKQSEEQLFYDASHDQLTGLANRGLFLERLQMAIDRAQRNMMHQYAVLFLDLDRFKVINDSLGHAAGDELLVEASRRLATCMRKTDLIARLGGDEFAVLMEDFADERDPIRTAERIHQAVSQSFYLDENEVFTTASVGIATGKPDYREAEDIVRDADTAMYRAKANGKAQHVLFDVELHQEAMERLRVENDLRRAVENDEFMLVYQPIISVETRRTVGFEALIRWNHPEKGLISPVLFIPIAEETGLISPIGWWILDTACRQLKDWQDRNCVSSEVTVAVNISGKQFVQVDFVEQLMEIVTKTGLPTRSLKLEVTESVIAQNPDKVKLILEDIREAGIQLCIDDFGTGYSSFSYLHRFPFDVLKIDRSFIGNIDTNSEAWEISQALVAMSHKLDLRVVAEGVEKPEQLARLREMDCDMAQGYLMAKPMLVEDVEVFMQHEPEVWEKPAAMVG